MGLISRVSSRTYRQSIYRSKYDITKFCYISIKMPNSSSTNTTESVQYNGWLHKWTNYIHGYQKRYFMIENDYLSYYRSDAENQSCRGRLKLSSANFHIQSSTMFCITSGTQNYTLKAQNETHRQRWITNLELAKTQARQNKEALRKSR